MGEDNHQGAARQRTEQENNKQPSKVSGIVIITGAWTALGIVTGVNGYLFHPVFIILFIPAILIGGGKALHEFLKSRLGWTDDNVFFCSWMCPMVVGVLIAFAYVIAWPSPSPDSHPKLTFALWLTDQVDDQIPLTNEVLAVREFGVIRRLSKDMILILPTPGTLDIFRFVVSNDSPIAAKGTEVVVSLPQTWKCEASFGWEEVFTGNMYAVLNKRGIIETNMTQSWGTKVGQMLSGNGTILGNFRIKEMPTTEAPSHFGFAGLVSIIARAEDSPAYCVRFGVELVSTNDASKPYWVFRTNSAFYGVESLEH